MINSIKRWRRRRQIASHNKLQQRVSLTSVGVSISYALWSVFIQHRGAASRRHGTRRRVEGDKWQSDNQVDCPRPLRHAHAVTKPALRSLWCRAQHSSSVNVWQRWRRWCCSYVLSRLWYAAPIYCFKRHYHSAICRFASFALYEMNRPYMNGIR